ncbi:unnamed protein product [Mytilus coruscus]|uniref:Ig-like domain-containing protein n=1 Tax=Mytilus coruscus TaxID=42192 RepID=A0A6J8AI31_MYTCO|nr:unnamed protein product [Mytilus coruscus]
MPTQLKIINTDSKNLVHGHENIPVNLTCTVISGKPKETLSWIFNNTVLVSDNSSDRLSYMILPDRKFNSRRYTCQADNRYLDSPLQISISLNIDYIPNVSVIVTPNSTVYEGTSVIFECMHDVKYSTVVNWLKHGNIIPSFKSKLQYFDNIDRSDAGVYSCRVMANIQYDSENVSLTVLYSPDVFVIDYKNGTLFCNATGNPDKYTYAQWEHSSSMNNHIRYINGSEHGHLHIDDLAGSNWFYYSGIYTCFAENGVIRNDMRYQSGSQHIEFKGIPQCLKDLIFKHGIQGQSTKISIELYSVPQYDSFHWKTLTGPITNVSSKYDTAVTETHFKTVLYEDVSFEVVVWKFSLVIYDLNQDDFDIYTLQVANKIGNTSCSVRLQPTIPGDDLA